jgi:hypothetical protein
MVMAEVILERVQRYILDGGDEDLRRLLGISQLTGEMARSAFRGVGIRQGGTAIDCGCGPIGALAVMAEVGVVAVLPRPDTAQAHHGVNTD